MSDAAVASIVTGVVTVATMIVGFLTLLVKLKYGTQKAEKAVEEAVKKADVVERKIDANTKITKEGVETASTNAQAAAVAATQASVKADSISERLNGKLEQTIRTVVEGSVEPVSITLKSHIEQDEKNMKEIRDKVDELSGFVRKRDHDMLNFMQQQSLKIDMLLLNKEKEKG